MVRRVLLVEDEYLLATRIADEFGQLGVEAVGPAGSVEQALELVEHGGISTPRLSISTCAATWSIR